MEKKLKIAIDRKTQINCRSRKLDNVKKAKLIKMACSKFHKGASNKTLQFMANKLIELNIMD